MMEDHHAGAHSQLPVRTPTAPKTVITRPDAKAPIIR